MQVLDVLRDGRFGVQLDLPARLALTRQDLDSAHLVDEAAGIEWFVFAAAGLVFDLAPAHRADLRAALDHYARDLFELRNQDPSWSPMVDVDHLVMGGAPALRMIHRTADQPGLEVVMGHLLIPVQGGLFEARVLCGDRDDAVYARPALERARTALRWLERDGGLRVLEPAPPIACGEIELPRHAIALTPPPRFALARPDDGDARFHRCSFSATDGHEVLHAGADAPDTVPLRDRAIEASRARHAEQHIEDLRVDLEEIGAHVLVFVEGRGRRGRMRSAVRWFLDDDRRACYVGITASDAVPRDVRARELAATVRSWRRIAPTRTDRPPRASTSGRRPWWRFW